MIDQPKETKIGFLRMPALPVSGFLVRFLALILDLILILSGIHLLKSSMPDLFRSLGEWAPFATSAIAFFYFVLLNGPYGKGRTIGKMLLKIEVTDLDGSYPSIRQSVMRTFILFPIFFTAPLADAIFGEPNSIMHEYFKYCLRNPLTFAVLIGTAISLPFNPFKQGLHDFFSGTLVRPIRHPDETRQTFDEMRESVGHSWLKFYRQPQYSAGVTVVLILVLILGMSFPGQWPVHYKEAKENYYSIKDESPFPSAHLSFNPTLGYHDLRDESGIVLPNDLRILLEDSLTSDSLSLFKGESEMPEAQLRETELFRRVVFTVPITKTSQWTVDPNSAEYTKALDSLADIYVDKILAPLLLNNIDSENAQKNRQVVQELVTKPITIVFLFQQYTRLTPYPFPIVDIAGFHSKDYGSALEMNLIQDEEMIADLLSDSEEAEADEDETEP